LSKLSDFLKKNRKAAYSVAGQNTPKDKMGQAVIRIDDEWREEKEWEEVNKRNRESNNIFDVMVLVGE
jgi:hypothetical protein